jgi:hypothetical protein
LETGSHRGDHCRRVKNPRNSAKKVASKKTPVPLCGELVTVCLSFQFAFFPGQPEKFPRIPFPKIAAAENRPIVGLSLHLRFHFRDRLQGVDWHCRFDQVIKVSDYDVVVSDFNDFVALQHVVIEEAEAVRRTFVLHGHILADLEGRKNALRFCRSFNCERGREGNSREGRNMPDPIPHRITPGKNRLDSSARFSAATGVREMPTVTPPRRISERDL